MDSSTKAGVWPGATWRTQSRTPLTSSRRSLAPSATSTSWYMRHTGNPYTGSVFPPANSRKEIREPVAGAIMRGVTAWPVTRPETAYMNEFGAVASSDANGLRHMTRHIPPNSFPYLTAPH